MKKIFLLLAILISYDAFSQDVIIDQNVDDQYQDTKGPNMQKYSQLYSTFGVIPTFDNEGVTSVNFWQSYDLGTGYRYKRKISSFYAVGFDVSFSVRRYGFEEDFLDPTISQILTYPTTVKRHALIKNSFALELYQRFNFGPRGNTLGNFLDMGIFGEWNNSVKEIHVLETSDNLADSERVRVTKRKLDFIERWGYGVTARIGHNNIALYGKYRISDFFSDDYDLPELPRLIVGIELSVK